MRSLLRRALRNPGVSVAVMSMTAIGIALGTLGVAVFDALHWRPLPFLDPSSAVVLYSRHESLARCGRR